MCLCNIFIFKFVLNAKYVERICTDSVNVIMTTPSFLHFLAFMLVLTPSFAAGQSVSRAASDMRKLTPGQPPLPLSLLCCHTDSSVNSEHVSLEISIKRWPWPLIVSLVISAGCVQSHQRLCVKIVTEFTSVDLSIRSFTDTRECAEPSLWGGVRVWAGSWWPLGTFSLWRPS